MHNSSTGVIPIHAKYSRESIVFPYSILLHVNERASGDKQVAQAVAYAQKKESGTNLPFSTCPVIKESLNVQKSKKRERELELTQSLLT